MAHPDPRNSMTQPTGLRREPAARRVIVGDRPPSYVSKSTLAAELDMSETTVDSYVQRGLLPQPYRWGGSVRWCWADVTAYLNARAAGVEDQFLKGVDNV